MYLCPVYWDEVKKDTASLQIGLDAVKMDTASLRVNLEEVKEDVRDIKLGQLQLSKDIASSLGQYTKEYKRYVDSISNYK